MEISATVIAVSTTSAPPTTTTSTEKAAAAVATESHGETESAASGELMDVATIVDSGADAGIATDASASGGVQLLETDAGMTSAGVHIDGDASGFTGVETTADIGVSAGDGGQVGGETATVDATGDDTVATDAESTSSVDASTALGVQVTGGESDESLLVSTAGQRVQVGISVGVGADGSDASLAAATDSDDATAAGLDGATRADATMTSADVTSTSVTSQTISTSADPSLASEVSDASAGATSADATFTLAGASTSISSETISTDADAMSSSTIISSSSSSNASSCGSVAFGGREIERSIALALGAERPASSPLAQLRAMSSSPTTLRYRLVDEPPPSVLALSLNELTGELVLRRMPTRAGQFRIRALAYDSRCADVANDSIIINVSDLCVRVFFFGHIIIIFSFILADCRARGKSISANLCAHSL